MVAQLNANFNLRFSLNLRSALILEPTAFGLLLHPINSLFLRPFHPKRAYFVHPHCSVWTKRAIVFGIPEIRFVHLQGFFVSAEGFEPSANGLKGHCSAVELRAREKRIAF